ncbi:peptidase inhibitor family I36 protein [Streptomyces tanashiensis]|uniref:peptidase inhibitor family I36 protein n=1 Tax=Streptomyces tanashiensis TaxID=67367 RepID=UPI0036CBF8C5
MITSTETRSRSHPVHAPRECMDDDGKPTEERMSLKNRLSSIALAGGLAITGLAATAPTAAADTPCPSGKLCLYKSTLYRELTFTTSSTAVCYSLDRFGMGPGTNGVNSYRNNLPVKATLYNQQSGAWWDPDGYYVDYTINPGSFSSNTYTAGDMDLYVCMGSAKPWDKPWSVS